MDRWKIIWPLFVWAVIGCSGEAEQGTSATGHNTPATVQGEEQRTTQGVAEETETRPRGTTEAGKAETGKRDLIRTGKTWAVVIGVGEYEHVTDLRFTNADAQAVAEVLQQAGGVAADQILTMKDDSQAQLQPTAEKLRANITQWLQQAGPRDTMLVFFAGHGTLGFDGALYLAPQDVELVDAELEPTGVRNGLALSWLRQQLASCQAQTKLLLLDACHSGSARNGANRQLQADGEKLAEVFQGLEGLMTIASCQGRQKSIESESLGHGLFSHWLVQGLGGQADKDRDAAVQCDELYEFLYKNVSESARQRQVAQTPVRSMVGLSGLPVVVKLHSATPAEKTADTTTDATAKPLPTTISALPAGEVLRIAYTQKPPQAENSAGLKMEVAVRARRGAGRELQPLADGDPVASEKDDYQILVRPGAAGYLYVFQLDSNGQLCWLFPRNSSSDFSSGENPVRSQTDLLIPQMTADQTLFLDSCTGIEQVYAVLTAAPWPELEKALARASTAPAQAAPANRSGLMQAPNRLGTRGVGGVRPVGSGPAQAPPQTYTASRALVLERWFRHVE